MFSSLTTRLLTEHASTRLRASTLALAVAGAFALPAAYAQQAADATSADAPTASSGGTLQEIIVTATRHAEALSKVAVSATAMSQETMDLKGIKDFTEVAKFTPGVSIDSSGGNSISIRGISASGGSGTTGIYIDDTPIQMRALGFNADDALPKTFDLDHIEVLRGPQGTLFGAGSEGGTVRYIMAQPNMHGSNLYARTEVSTTQGGAPSYEAGIAGGTALVDNVLGMRASLWYRHDGGWIDRIDPTTLATLESNANYSDTVAGRLAVKWAVNDSWTISPSVLFQDRRAHNNDVYWNIYSSTGNYRNADPDPHAQPDHYFMPSLKVETDLFGASLISNTSYYNRRDISGYDGTSYNLSYFQTFAAQGLCQNGTQTSPNACPASTNTGGGALPSWYPLIDGTGIHLPAGLQNYRSPATVTNEQNSLTEELRLQSSDPMARLTWTTGLFASVNRQTSVEEINDPMLAQLFSVLFNQTYQSWFTDAAGNALSLLPNGDDYYNRNYSRDLQVAVFGEATYALTPKLKATAGLRYAKVNVNFDHFSAGPQNFGTSANSGTESEKPFTPKLSISYQADQSNMYYATYAKGYRIGGADPYIPPVCGPDLQNLGLASAPQSYKSDTVDSYEIGAKNKIGNNLRIASSAYWIRWNNIQQNIYLPGCGFQTTLNEGTAVAKGADAQIEWAPTDQLNFEAAVGFTDARYQQDVGGGLIAKAGDAVVGESGTPTAPWTVSLGGQYDFQLSNQKSFIRLDASFQSQSQFRPATQEPGTGQYSYWAYNPKAYTTVSLRAGTAMNKNWNITGFIENLFNAQPVLPPSSYPYSDKDPYNPYVPATATTAASGASSLIRSYTITPRTIGVTATYRW
jgi:outer membrane receptor protein involved in Fe transport